MLVESGAPGHLPHPFELPTINTGHELVWLFRQTNKFLTENPSMASVKIDGVNTSVKLTTVGDSKQFVIDRGSNKELDLRGVSKLDLQNRFNSTEMAERSGRVLDILNKAIPSILPELKELGLVSNPYLLLNIEYVDKGQTNVKEYADSFIAIHGLLELKPQLKGRRIRREIPSNPKVMDSLIAKLEPIASKFGFKVLGSVIPTKIKEPDFDSILAKKFTIYYSDERKITNTLQKWLDGAEYFPLGKRVQLQNGKQIKAMGRDIFMKIMDEVKLDDLLLNPEQYNDVINGFFAYMGTMKLGEELLSCFNSDLGPVQDQEGLVIRGLSLAGGLAGEPFKITGNFMVSGAESKFNK